MHQRPRLCWLAPGIYPRVITVMMKLRQNYSIASPAPYSPLEIMYTRVGLILNLPTVTIQPGAGIKAEPNLYLAITTIRHLAQQVISNISVIRLLIMLTIWVTGGFMP